MKLKILAVLLAVGAATCAGVFIDFSPSSKKFVLVGSGGISGVYFRIAGQLCTLLNETDGDVGLDCSVQSTPGSLYNMNSLIKGDTDLVLAQDDWSYQAFNGEGFFDKPAKNIRLIAKLYQEPLTIIARKDSNIKVVNDLLGKRINLGAPGSGLSGAMQALMAQKGWNKGDFKLTTRLKDAEQAQALCDNKIDAMITVIGHPNGAVQEAMATCDVNFVHLDHEVVSALVNRLPYYKPYRIPKEIYRLEEDISTVSFTTEILTTDSLNYSIGYSLARLMVEKFDMFRSIHPALEDLHPEDLVLPGFMPFHDGARDFYKESGILK